MIRLYLKIPEKFVRLILLNRFWVVHIPFHCMVKFQFLAQLPVDYLANIIGIIMVKVFASDPGDPEFNLRVASYQRLKNGT